MLIDGSENKKKFCLTALLVVLAFFLKEPCYAIELQLDAQTLHFYDSNITYAHVGTFKDWGSKWVADVQLDFENSLTRFDMNAHLGQAFYYRYSEFNHPFGQLDLIIDRQVNRQQRIRASNFFKIDDFLVSEDGQVEIRGERFLFYQYHFNLSYFIQLNSILSSTYGYNYRLFFPTSSVVSQTNNHQAEAEWRWRLNPTSQVAVDYHYEMNDFNPGLQLSLHQLSVSGYHDLLKYLTMVATAGMACNVDQEQRWVIGPIYRFALKQQLSRTYQLELQLAREQQSRFLWQDVFDVWKVSARLSAQLLRSWRGSGQVQWAKGKFTAIPIQEETLGLDIVLTYSVRQVADFMVTYNFTSALASEEGLSFNKSMLSLACVIPV